jgi:hypothetical protein
MASLLARVIYEVGKYKDIYKLDKHGLAPKKRVLEGKKLKKLEKTLADIALSCNRNDIKVGGKEFLKAEKGYFKGYRPQKSNTETDNTSIDSNIEEGAIKGKNTQENSQNSNSEKTASNDIPGNIFVLEDGIIPSGGLEVTLGNVEDKKTQHKNPSGKHTEQKGYFGKTQYSNCDIETGEQKENPDQDTSTHKAISRKNIFNFFRGKPNSEKSVSKNGVEISMGL